MKDSKQMLFGILYDYIENSDLIDDALYEIKYQVQNHFEMDENEYAIELDYSTKADVITKIVNTLLYGVE